MTFWQGSAILLVGPAAAGRKVKREEQSENENENESGSMAAGRRYGVGRGRLWECRRDDGGSPADHGGDRGGDRRRDHRAGRPSR